MSEQVTWYHGTRRGFTKGGALFPRTVHHNAPTSAPTAPGRNSPDDATGFVYLTTRLDLAWAYAWHAPGRGRPKVLTVHPHGTLEPDPEHSPDMQAWRCEWATVTGVLTEPTITEDQARAGWAHT